MHHVNRQALNGRFCSVYTELVDRGVIVKNDRKKSKTVFAHTLGTKGHIIDLYLQGKRKITYEQAKLLCSAYKVNESYMFQGQGKPFNGQLPKEDRLAMALGIDFNPNILFTNVEAFSSNTVGVDLLEDTDHFRIPGLLGDLIAFNINGNSMAPTIKTGDMVICNPIETFKEMKDNDIYAVVTKQSVWVKRVQKCFDKFGRWTHLKLISDNFHEYDPFLVELKEVRRLLKVKRKLTGLE